MKITLLGSGSYKSSLSIRLLALAQHLKISWDVTMIVPGADKYNNFILESHASVPGITLVQPWQFTTKSAMLNLIPYLFSSFWALLKARPHVIYLYKPTPITILGLLPRLLFGTPVILDLDDLGSEVMKLEGQPKLQYALVAWCERLAMRYASAIVVTSTYLESLVRQRHPHQKILLLANGVEPGDYLIDQTTPLRQAVYYFGAVNRLDLIRSLLQAAPAIAKQVPEVKVTIAGGGTALDEAKTLVRQLGIEDSVTFTGWIKMLDVQQYVQFGDVAICSQPDTPTVRAASNMKVFQYMAMGSVPVVSDVGDLKLYVKDGEAGLVVSADAVDTLAATIVELLTNPTRRTNLAHAAYQLAQNEYSWENRTKQLQAFIADILATKRNKT